MSGWTVVDANSNKSLPVGGTQNSGVGVAYTAPSPASVDPVGKFRVSQPQALIDTDFEYGTQPTKWESIALQNNRQSCYYIPQQPLTITALNGAGTRTLTVVGTFVVPANSLIYIQNAFDANANGWWFTAAGGTNTMTVTTSNNVASGNQFNPALTYVYRGFFYSGCGINLTGTSAFTSVGTTVTVTTTGPHGLSAGSLIYVTGTTAATSDPPNGAWIVATTPTANTFTFLTAVAPVGAITNTAGAVNLFARPAGYVESRSFDGGVAFTSGANVPNAQLIRQTRRYFRYQSGKGIQFSTGTSLRPTLFTTSLTSSGTTVTVTTRYNHNLAVGCVVEVSGATQTAYNGTFTILTTPTPTTFTYAALSTPSAATATGEIIRVVPTRWFGSSNRIGMFDQQNGFFFEYDGQTLYAVLRSSVLQINGTVALTQGSTLVTGTGTQFTTQLIVGDFIVLRGQSYRVMTILSDTQLHIGPEYRGASISSGAIVSKTVDTRIPQSQWTDPCNGTGPSGYNLDLNRMQMFYIDYSWYGAGTIRFGLRTTKGQIAYVTEIQNNNIRYEAYMRSGNMASHYESNGITPMTQITASIPNTTTTTTAAVTAFATTIPVTSNAIFNTAGGVVSVGSELIFYGAISGNNLINCIRGYNNTLAAAINNGATVTPSSISVLDASTFAPAGTVRVQASGVTGVIEHINYSGRTNNMLFGLTRAQTGGQGSAQAFTFSATAPVAVEYAAPDTAAALSHWGSSVIMDGNYNDDKSLIFNFGTTAPVTTTSTSPIVLLAIRIAPSVDNGTTGLFGAKETINRLQLQLVELGLYTTGTGYLINLILNGFASGAMSGSFVTPIQQPNGITSSLAQVASNTNAVTVTGGESVAAAYTNPTGQTTLDLTQVRDLGNSILGGGTSATVPTSQAGFYPDGPDILYVVATPLTATSSTILARLSWKEAQA